jgi:hypothetical protein
VVTREPEASYKNIINIVFDDDEYGDDDDDYDSNNINNNNNTCVYVLCSIYAIAIGEEFCLALDSILRVRIYANSVSNP